MTISIGQTIDHLTICNKFLFHATDRGGLSYLVRLRYKTQFHEMLSIATTGDVFHILADVWPLSTRVG
jgi:hypothetical protein